MGGAISRQEIRHPIASIQNKNKAHNPLLNIAQNQERKICSFIGILFSFSMLLLSD